MRVSVCMATYNGEKHIKKQLESILPYLDKEDEVIISDDSSTDNTINIIKEMNDKRIRLLTGHYRNPIYNFENALKHISNDYVFLADQDDIWFPEKIPTVIELLKEYDLVINDCVVTDKNLKVIHPSFFQYIHAKKGLVPNLLRNRYIGACMAFNTKILQKSLPFPNKIPMHDWWIGLIASCYGKVYLLRKPMMYHIRHGKNASNTGFKSKRSLQEKIGIRFHLLASLIYKVFKNIIK